jgi:hypothetical protein
MAVSIIVCISTGENSLFVGLYCRLKTSEISLREVLGMDANKATDFFAESVLENQTPTEFADGR